MLPFVATQFHTGAEFESGAAHRARSCDEPMREVELERGELEDDDRVQEGGWTSGHENTRDIGGRQKRLRPTLPHKTIVIPGKGPVTVYKSDKASEDERWVYILEVQENGTRKYLCADCRKQFTGHETKVISHKLQLNDGMITICPKAPSVECRLALERVKKEKDAASARGGRAGRVSGVNTMAVGRTMGIQTSFAGGVNRVEEADAALVRWAVSHDIPWAAMDSRDHLWVEFIEKLKLAGSSWKVPAREVLSCCEQRGKEARAGGLFIALKAEESEKLKILTQAIKEGGTLVSDGAKLSSRKRGMLNSVLVTWKGVIFLQQTDGTGKTKDGEFLRDDYISAIEKAGPISIVSSQRSDGTLVTKKKSAIVKLVVTDRGGGCVRALSLMEEAMVILADTCKGHLADLLIEDWAKPFKVHLKKVHMLIIFIVSHSLPYSLFASYDEVLALLLPADTRFATEIICARSLQQDKNQVRKLFVDAKFDEWQHQQDRKLRTLAREIEEPWQLSLRAVGVLTRNLHCTDGV
ncbi:hypothetical protein AB1Y20_010941 [Prymnesium parvum]|uniref:Uncharacterized protein n=1 Tax=Prymnesium parvum TaxID=97485 RepID=A0AB34ISQ7_PRYPA